MAHRMILHKSKEFKDIIEATAQKMNLRPVFIEKDYWVTYILKQLSDSPYNTQIVFKGGTSLSKAYGFIDRFSEDIDLAVLSPANYSDGKMKALLKNVSAHITKDLTLIDGHKKEIKFGRNRTTAYEYFKSLGEQNFRVMKDYVLLEINCSTNPVPHNRLPVQSYVGNFLRQYGEEDLVAESGLESFTLNVLSAERTYFEKALSLSRLSYEGIDTLKEKVRHFFDISCLQQIPGLSKIHSHASYEIIRAIRNDDANNRTMQGEWMNHSISHAPLFTTLEDTWKSIAPVYEKEMGQLVWSSIPTSDEVYVAFAALRSFMQTFDKEFPLE